MKQYIGEYKESEGPFLNIAKTTDYDNSAWPKAPANMFHNYG